jgi:cell division protein FtsN
MKRTNRSSALPAGNLNLKHGKPARSGGGTLLGIFVGLVLGMVIAFGVVWYLRKAPLPFESKAQSPTPTANAKGDAPKSLPLPGKSAGEVDAKPRFDFYGILEGKQTAAPPADAKPAAQPPLPAPPVVAPTAKPATEPAAATTPAAAVPADRLYLQAGAFAKSEDADNMKAKLTLMGFEAQVSEADIPDKGRMFRVRTGPYSSPDEMNRVRTQLSQNGVQASLVKLH